MPELPEVETTRRGIAPLLEGRRLAGAEVRCPKLRLPLDPRLGAKVRGRRVLAVERRAKYLVIRLEGAGLLLHLGMSGSLRLVRAHEAPGPHDHVDLLLARGERLRFRDPRRFGLLLLTGPDPGGHPLLARLGPEPLEPGFDGTSLRKGLAGRSAAVKVLLLDSRVVAGVGNIYACEALHRAGIRPSTPADRVSAGRCQRLAAAIRETLAEAIVAGGTTLRDFRGSRGEPGYFASQLAVYGRAGEPCPRCQAPIRVTTIGQRSTFYCSRCQH